jgi:hypothetical protein
MDFESMDNDLLAVQVLRLKDDINCSYDSMNRARYELQRRMRADGVRKISTEHADVELKTTREVTGIAVTRLEAVRLMPQGSEGRVAAESAILADANVEPHIEVRVTPKP